VDIERYLWHARRILSLLGNRCAAILRDAAIGVHAPEGAFYLFLDFGPLRRRLAERGITDGVALCDQLLAEAGVAILPGASFARTEDELTARLAYVDFDGAAALAASENIALENALPEGFAERWCERVLQGVTRLVEWLGR